MRSEIEPNLNPPVGGVGPNVPVAGDPSAIELASGGYGATHVMTSPEELAMMPWAGWPVQWQTPTAGGGYDVGRGLDVVFGCVDLNARTTADMPVYVTKDGVRQPPPSWLPNPQPEVYTTWIEFFRQTWMSYQAAGEAFIAATSWFAPDAAGRSRPRTFMCLHPSTVDPQLDPLTGLRTYWINGQPAEPGEVLHIRYSTNQLQARGVGPLEYAGARIHAAQALARYGTELANNGGVPWAVLQHKYRLKPGQAEAMKRQWISAAHNRMGAPAVLDSDTQLKELQVNPKDMALADLQSHAEARLSVLLGVPPFLMGLPSGGDSMTYSSVTALFSFHWRSMLKPGAGFIIRALSEWLLPRGTELEINPAAYIEESPAIRAQYYEAMDRIGAITTDEIRAAERFAPATSQEPTPAAAPPVTQPPEVDPDAGA